MGKPLTHGSHLRLPDLPDLRSPRPHRRWDLCELAGKLVDLGYRFQLRRFGHSKTVGRVTGSKRDAGGAPGVARVVERRFFPELPNARPTLRREPPGSTRKRTGLDNRPRLPQSLGA